MYPMYIHTMSSEHMSIINTDDIIKPPTDAQTLEEYMNKRREYGRALYHKHKVLKPKYVCAFVNYRGEACTKTSFQTHCSLHRRRLALKEGTNVTVQSTARD
jgi:hypothetical protein